MLSADLMCPAAGQGALGIEIRADDIEVRECVAFLNHAPTRAAVQCERAALAELGGGCQVPIGAHAESSGSELHLTAVVARPDGSELLREARSGTAPDALGREVVQALLARGAAQILQDVYGAHVAAP